MEGLRRWIVELLPASRREVEALRARLEGLEASLADSAPVQAGGRRGAADPERPDVEEQRAEIRRMLAAGRTQAEIARRLGVSRQWVHKLVRRGL